MSPSRSAARPPRAARTSYHCLSRAVLETLEERRLFAIARPDHVVVIIEEDRFTNAIGDTARLPYVNQLAAGGLVYNNSHAPLHPSRPDYYMLFSGSTQGITDNYSDHALFTGPNLAKSLNSTPGMSFVGYSESLPADGSLIWEAPDSSVDPSNHPDVYFRGYNPMSWFADYGGKTMAQVNRTFKAFPTDFTQLPTVSFVIPDMLHNTHGSNEAPYTNASSDYSTLRINADAWLKSKFDAYVQWAKANNSLLIITTDEDDVGHNPAAGITTMVVGDPRLVLPGTNNTSIGHYNTLRTIMDMYGLAPIGGAATVAAFPTNASGQLIPTGAVSQKSTTTALTTTLTPSVFGQSVTFTAAITSPQGGTPTGSVTFKDGSTTLGTATVNASGQAVLPTSSLSVATHTISAVYNGDANYTTSTSSNLSQVVNRANTTTTISATSAKVFGQSVSFTATVAAVVPGTGTPTGTVQFVVDGSNFGSPVTLSGGSATSSATSSLAVGSHTISAVYAASTNYNTSTATTVNQQVNQASTTTSISSSANPATSGQSITFTGTVAAVAPGSGIPAGTIQFVIDNVNFGSPVALVSGSATSAAISSLTDGPHSVKAVYSGNASYTTSTSSTLTQNVGPISTSTALASNANPAVSGQSITLTATVTASGVTPSTGSIDFIDTDTATTLATVALNAQGKATFTSTMTPGSHHLKASYSGATGLIASASSTITQTVNAASTSTAIASSANPSTSGQSVSFTATVSVTSPGAGTPTGSVQFVIDNVNFGGPVLLLGGSATSDAINSLTGGGHSVKAIYSGDGNFNTSTSSTLTQNVVVPVNTSITLGSSANPSVFGQSITLTATVTGSTTPNVGTVTFTDGATTLGTGTVNASGIATLTFASGLALGGHSIDASYGGSGLFLASSTTSSLAQQVNAANTTTALTSSANPSSPGQSVTFTATVSAQAPGAGTRTGTVQFVIDNVNFGAPVAINASGVAVSSATTTLAGGGHSVVAIYSGDSNFNGSTSSTLTQNVNVGPPANDAFGSRIGLGTVSSASATGTNVGATKQSGEPAHAGNAGGKSVWWTWTAPAAGTVTIDTANSSFDTLLAAYTGTGVTALTSVASNDNDGALTTSKITFTAVASRVYQIAVDGFGGASGSIALHVLLASPPAVPKNVLATSGWYTDRVEITWTASAGADSYDVYRSPNSSHTNAIVFASNVTGTKVIDFSTPIEQEFWYWVIAKNQFGSSAASIDDDGYRTEWPTPPAGISSAPLNTLQANTLVVDGTSKSDVLEGIKTV